MDKIYPEQYLNPLTGEQWRVTAIPFCNDSWYIWKQKNDLNWKLIKKMNVLTLANEIIRNKCGGDSAIKIEQ